MTATLEKPVAYKVLLNGESCHGGTLRWSLPTDAPGEWHEVAGQITACSNGLHLTTLPINWWKSGAKVYEAEYDGDTDAMNDKIAVRRCRLVREVEWDQFQVFSSGDHAVSAGRALAFDNATVRAFGNATVRAFGNATVRASGNATVRAFDNATVRASGNATVRAFDNATVEAFGNATVEALGNATVRASGNATVRAFGNATVRAFGNATVRASGNATVRAFGNATVRAFDNATVRASGNATVLRARWHSGGWIKLSDLAVVVDRRKDGAVDMHAAPWTDAPSASGEPVSQ